MGMDFTALLKVAIPFEKSPNVINLLESQSPNEVKRIADKWTSSSFANIRVPSAIWQKNTDAEEVVYRPKLPSLDVSLRTPEGFFMTFSMDSVRVYHPLRWHIFLTDLDWQNSMLDACKSLATVMGASEGIITNDCSLVIEGFFQGLSFEKALECGQGKDGEVLNLSDMYEEIDELGTWHSHGYWRFLKQ